MNPLLKTKSGQKRLLLGNQAIVRGALEAGVAFVTCYPGTPSSEISDSFFELSNESNIYFEYSTNEKVALEVGAGAAGSGLRTLIVMKHVGVNVAADPLMTLAYVGVEGGTVVISADDPSLFSSQNEQDNRYYGKLSSLPILEPSSPEEAKDMIKDAFDISEVLKVPVIFRTTTRINHSRGVVTFGRMKKRVIQGKFVKNPGLKVTLPGVSRTLHKILVDKYARAFQMANGSPYNFIKGRGKLGIITNGISYAYVMDALSDLKLKNNVAVLRLGYTHPFPKKLVQRFLRNKEKVLVVEELEPYMEEEAKTAAQEAGLTIPIAGKSDKLFSRLFEFDPGMVRAKIAKYFSVKYKAPKPVKTSGLPEIPNRPPNLCPGCPHRSTFYSVKKIAGLDTVYPTDIGCYTLGFMPPLRMADFLLCMGSSISTACGISKATGRKTVGFIGDSTFFHSGMTGLVDAVHNKHNVLLIILDNGTTAMTGHQIHPGVDTSLIGRDKQQIKPESVVRGIGVKDVYAVKPRNLKKMQEAVKSAMAYEGVSVIISEEVCPLYAQRTGEFSKKMIFEVDQKKCKNKRDCLNLLACPAFYLEGDKVMINPDLCIGCAVCSQVCPEHAIRPVKLGEQS
ncbi:MAG: indolepyruvate ferredoxin oxidoreductase subunit alpha [Deltaproteobacteria bacterium]|nr:indolepyruvate ferredoxin oxidoreductase subunit alpha [Deltaproteobacteria bacterium]MBW2051978.1 indolepyruvate ferredoxin oxidoreductase subunit alpha [Deltaproteobacteria bacterium]MBW2141067.1 indolepyruvate ferredoxin oxidoreductase subunit alpha [Deltaproteobacteria bacterium]MBW2323119.1 indolepyruvate ferredoxin oxidoreductase subunit alpha [Deltaproteobacteria bacterium]